MAAVEITASGQSARAPDESWSVDATGSQGSAAASGAAWSAQAAEAASTATASSGVIVGGTAYSGAYEVTPTTEAQTLPTALRTLSQDVTINPIPSNYGLITWDGSVLTVS